MSRDDKRQTGRTTRMLQAAIKAVAGGSYAFVIAANKEHASLLWYECIKLCGQDQNTVRRHKVYPPTGGQITIMSADDPSWSWQTREVLGALPAFRVFVDHFAVECEYDYIIDLWEAFDD